MAGATSTLLVVGDIHRQWRPSDGEFLERGDHDLTLFVGDFGDEDVNMVRQIAGLAIEKAVILGNHDARWDCGHVRQAMTDLGWSDLSSRVLRLEHAERVLALGGTETPWMGRNPDYSQVPDSDFRVLLSHTPDNFPWSVDQDVDLVLAGHNHGGQVVLPVIGPVYSPSWYGVRYASGVFWQEPCLMHVTRGVSGLHPLRWRCRPELVKLVLRSQHTA